MNFLAALKNPDPGAATPDLKMAPPVDVFPYPLWMVVTAAVLLLALLGGLIFLLWKWWKARPREPQLTPRERALRELEALRARISALDPHAFGFAVSDVLRDYVSAAYGLHAPRQTSSEFLTAIARSGKFTTEDRARLSVFLEHCDLLKFARLSADSSQSEDLLASAVALVQGGRK